MKLQFFTSVDSIKQKMSNNSDVCKLCYQKPVNSEVLNWFKYTFQAGYLLSSVFIQQVEMIVNDSDRGLNFIFFLLEKTVNIILCGRKSQIVIKSIKIFTEIINVNCIPHFLFNVLYITLKVR